MDYVIIFIVLLSHDVLNSGTYLSKFPTHRPFVYISNVNTAFLHEVFLISIIHGNDDLLSRWALSNYVDLWFGFSIAFDHILNVINVLCLEGRKDFLDFKNVFGITTYLRDLYI